MDVHRHAPSARDASARAVSSDVPSVGTRTLAALLFAGAAAAAAGLGSIATSRGQDWNDALEKPSWYPPDATFGIVWTILYVMIAAAGWLAWRSGGGWRTTVPWVVQIALNLAWSVIFFGLRRPGWALAEIVVLLAAIVWTIAAMWRVDRRAVALMLPYLAWVGFATVLNASLAVLNA